MDTHARSQRRWWSALALAFVIAASPSAAHSSAAAAAQTTLFHFRNGFWINLHHYLYASALADSGNDKARTTTSARAAIAGAPCQAFTPAQQQAWQGAVDFYKSNYASRDWLFDADLRHLNDVMSDGGDSEPPPAGLPSELSEQLKKVSAIYREACWPAQRKANAEWIAALQALLAQHGEAIASRLKEIYESPWPAEMVLDVVTYANWAGAYTYDTHITVGSVNADIQGELALETVFHESSHALGDKLVQEIRAAFVEHHSDIPNGFDHLLISYNAGALTKAELSKSDPGYIPYGDRTGLFKRVPHGSEDEAAFQKYWQPYLDGKSTKKAALDGLAAAICCGK